jgi:hypothetical protein
VDCDVGAAPGGDAADWLKGEGGQNGYLAATTFHSSIHHLTPDALLGRRQAARTPNNSRNSYAIIIIAQLSIIIIPYHFLLSGRQ